MYFIHKSLIYDFITKSLCNVLIIIQRGAVEKLKYLGVTFFFCTV